MEENCLLSLFWKFSNDFSFDRLTETCFFRFLAAYFGKILSFNIEPFFSYLDRKKIFAEIFLIFQSLFFNKSIANKNIFYSNSDLQIRRQAGTLTNTYKNLLCISLKYKTSMMWKTVPVEIECKEWREEECGPKHLDPMSRFDGWNRTKS